MSQTPTRPLRLRWAARTDVGLVRANNQDAVFAGDRLLAVADGMGGMAAGDVASQRAIEALGPLEESFDGSDIIQALRTAVADANQRIRDEVEADPAKEGMGTTLTAMLFADGRIGMVHIGDSRAYQLRGDEFRQITKDDTYVQMLVDEGRITPEEATTHPQRSLVSRVLQGMPTDPFYSVRRVRPGDRFLLCSDGLSGVLSQELLGEVLKDIHDVADCATRLVDLALAAGGPDNITAVVAEVVGGDAPPPRRVLSRIFRRPQ